jgi:hypothetical protein
VTPTAVGHLLTNVIEMGRMLLKDNPQNGFEVVMSTYELVRHVENTEGIRTLKAQMDDLEKLIFGCAMFSIQEQMLKPRKAPVTGFGSGKTAFFRHFGKHWNN